MSDYQTIKNAIEFFDKHGKSPNEAYQDMLTHGVGIININDPEVKALVKKAIEKHKETLKRLADR